MHKSLLAMFIATISSLFSEISFPKDASLPAAKDGYTYVLFQSTGCNLKKPAPGISLGLGHRHLMGNGALDISAYYGAGFSDLSLFWMAPKTSYLHYGNAKEKTSSYLGGGAALGGIQTVNIFGLGAHRKFVGIIPHVTLGYEFARRPSLLGFTEMTLSQPAIPFVYIGRFPRPIVGASVGVGF